MGHLSSLPGLLHTTANLQKPLSRQRTANIMSALETLHLVLAPPAAQSGKQVNMLEREAC